ncbi:hypothetical protein [Paraburkholderia mimosarum]|uniref:hypothetical protein n=1 Tax=Paraburkholderia mimosarum TaxID=312026 RepID=UPI0003FE7FA6|nr:hypothetical protein [Paraburkholderia mimosarum]
MSVSLTNCSHKAPATVLEPSLQRIIFRVLFYGTTLYASVLFWIAPRLPMADLAQHAAQVTLLRDLLAHTSPWADIVRINFFTPYLTGYGLALLLSYLMPVAVAMKVVMNAAYLGFVIGCVSLRKRFGGDERLDWLFIPGFFGFPFGWGFYTFLVAAPIGLAVILVAHTYAARPNIRSAIALLVAGIVLFFSHGLVFFFACAIGVSFLLVKRKSLFELLVALLPYYVFSLLCILFALFARETDPLIALQSYLPHPSWTQYDHRLAFPLLVWGTYRSGSIFVVPALFMLAAPFLLRLGINRSNRTALLPLLAVVAIWILVPTSAMKTEYLYERFAVFLMPTYAFAFSRQDPTNASERQRSLRFRPVMRESAVLLLMVIGCWSFLGVQTIRMHRFVAESASFETILERMEPGQRALSLIFDRGSDAYTTRMAYLQYGAWYQAERHGFVDYNFAWFLPQPVRFRSDHLPAMRPGFEWTPSAFDWKSGDGKLYRYFIVRDKSGEASKVLANAECEIRLVQRAAEWSLYERGTCR